MRKCSNYPLTRFPAELILRWNWKSAVLSSFFRGSLFFAANLRFGRDAAMILRVARCVSDRMLDSLLARALKPHLPTRSLSR